MPKGTRGADEVLAALGLDMGQREGLQARGGERAAAIASAFDAAGEEDAVSVVWKLSAGGLARLRGLESSLRLARRSGGRAGGRTLAQLEAEYSRLLQDRSLYEPAEFAVESREKKSGSSLKVLAYSQSHSASNIGRVTVSLLPGEAA